jgi:hypothetical protein
MKKEMRRFGRLQMIELRKGLRGSDHTGEVLAHGTEPFIVWGHADCVLPTHPEKSQG